MKICGKASLNRGQIQDKIDKGCNCLELHLGNEWKVPHNEMSLSCIYKNYKNLIKMVDIIAVHIPMVEPSLELLVHPFNIKLLEETCKLAEKCASYWNHRVVVVVHTESCFELISRMNNVLSNIHEEVIELLNKYPNVDLGIENVTPITMYEGSYKLRGGVLNDNVRLARSFNDKRVGTVFDACHGRITEKYLRAMSQHGIYQEYDFEWLMSCNRNNLKLIHLASFKGSGYGKYHGIACTNKEEMLQFCKIYKKLGLNCPITLEVIEDDYLDSKNYVKTRELLEMCWREINN